MPQHQDTMHINRSSSSYLLIGIRLKATILNCNLADPTYLRWCTTWSWHGRKSTYLRYEPCIQLNLPSPFVISTPCNVFRQDTMHNLSSAWHEVVPVGILPNCLICDQNSFFHPSHDGDPTHWLLKTLLWSLLQICDLASSVTIESASQSPMFNVPKLTLLSYLSFYFLFFQRAFQIVHQFGSDTIYHGIGELAIQWRNHLTLPVTVSNLNHLFDNKATPN